MQLQYKSLTLKMFGTLCNRKYNKGGPGQLNSWNATSSKNWKIFHFQDYDNWSPQDAYCEKMRWCNRMVKITLSLFLKHVAGFKFIKIVYITFQEQSLCYFIFSIGSELWPKWGKTRHTPEQGSAVSGCIVSGAAQMLFRSRCSQQKHNKTSDYWAVQGPCLNHYINKNPQEQWAYNALTVTHLQCLFRLDVDCLKASQNFKLFSFSMQAFKKKALYSLQNVSLVPVSGLCVIPLSLSD